MTVHLVGAGPGDPELLTVRAVGVLRAADVVLYDRLASVEEILALAPPSATMIEVGKQGGGPSRSQEEINALLVQYGRSHGTVVRLKSGDPFLFGRGGEEALVLAAAGIAVEVVPGVSSATGVPALAGIPVTHRGVSSSCTIVTGRTAPWAADTDWSAVAALGGTIVVLMGGAARAEISAALQAAGLDGATPAAVVSRGSRPDEVIVRTTLAGLASIDEPPGSPLIVIGEVAALDVLRPG